MLALNSNKASCSPRKMRSLAMHAAAVLVLLAVGLSAPRAVSAVSSQTVITTETCDGGDNTQQWQVHPSGQPTIIVKGSNP